MANSPGSKKRARQAEKNREHNASLRSRVRTYIKKTLKAAASGDYEQAQQAFREAVPQIDSMVNKGIFKKNKAARTKSRLNARVKALLNQS